jgi:pyruvate,orthophosphate dikinase
MMGHRGGVWASRIRGHRMQGRALFEAAAELLKEGKKPYPELMIPSLRRTDQAQRESSRRPTKRPAPSSFRNQDDDRLR